MEVKIVKFCLNYFVYSNKLPQFLLNSLEGLRRVDFHDKKIISWEIWSRWKTKRLEILTLHISLKKLFIILQNTSAEIRRKAFSEDFGKRKNLQTCPRTRLFDDYLETFTQ